MYDLPERLIDEKCELLDESVEQNRLLLFTHDPKIAAAYVSRDDKGRFVPRDSQPTLEGMEF